MAGLANVFSVLEVSVFFEEEGSPDFFMWILETESGTVRSVSESQKN